MVEEITPDDVKRKIDDGAETQIIDIRSGDEFAEGHIPGAQNVPLNELPSRIEEVDWGDDVVVACPIGQSSVQAARLIGSYEGVEDGDAVKSMAGGYDAWEYELESEE